MLHLRCSIVYDRPAGRQLQSNFGLKPLLRQQESLRMARPEGFMIAWKVFDVKCCCNEDHPFVAHAVTITVTWFRT